MLAVTVLLLAGALLALAWLYFSWHFDYWRARGVPYCNPFSVFGDRGAGLPFGQPLWELLTPVYNKHRGRERFVGTFQARQPVLVVLDPELIKTVLTKEFGVFHDRGMPFDEQNDPMSVNLFTLGGARWKNLRAKLSPVFTSGKLKSMVPLIEDVTKELVAKVRSLAGAGGGEVELKDPLLRYTTDVIGSVAFGISCNSLRDEKAEFYTKTREIFKPSPLLIIRLLLLSVHPIFAKLLPFKAIMTKTTDFFVRLMKETTEYREQKDITRNDFVQMMMELRASDRLQTDRVNHVEFTHGVMTAQAFLFFVAGLDSIANTVGFALHELALDPELQRRAAAQVREARAKHGGALSYEAIKSMELVDRIVKEALRKYTPAGQIVRAPTGRYKIPDSDVVVDETVLVHIPVWQLHHDPDLFPEPERFDPDRFLPENKERMHPYSYVPFGEGPRICIAERFAMLELKMCLAGLLEQFELSVGDKTDVTAALDPKSFGPTPAKGFWLRVQDRPAV